MRAVEDNDSMSRLQAAGQRRHHPQQTDSSNWRLRRTRWPPHSTATPLSDGGSGSGGVGGVDSCRTAKDNGALACSSSRAANTGRGGSPDDVPQNCRMDWPEADAWTTPRARILLVYSWQSPWLVVELPFNLIGIPGP